MLRIITFLLLINTATTSFSSNKEYKFYYDKIYESFISNNIKIWEGTVGIMEASYRNEPREELLYDIVLAHYGLIGYHLGFDNAKQGRYYLDRAEPYLEKLHKNTKYQAQAMAFQAAFYGFEMSLNRFKGATLGRKSYSAVDKALEIDPIYSGAWIEKGNLSFFTPSIFGGSKTEAVIYYSKAVELFEEELPYNQRWLYLNTLISLAKSHEYTGNVPEALKIMEKVLEFEPKFKWAKEDYLPNLEKKN